MASESTRPNSRWSRPYVYSGLLILCGLALAAGGMKLVALGGSSYYLVAGLAQALAGLLLLRRSRWGDVVFAGVILGTLGWSLAEVGLAPWSMVPRILVYAVLGLWLLVPWARRSLASGPAAGIPSPAGLAAGLCLAVLAVAFGRPQWVRSPYPLPPVVEQTALDGSEWRSIGNTLRGTRFSPLTQINVDNVRELEVAWTYRSGDSPNPMSSAEAAPLKIGDTLYTCTPHNVVIALDAASGTLRWRHDPKVADALYAIRTCRGVAYYQAPAQVAECPMRILAATIDGRLLALDAATGKPCEQFGTGGAVSLREGIGPAAPYHSYTTAAPMVVRNHVILGALVLDNQSIDMPSGVIRSFDAVTGQLQWAWDLGAPDRIGAPPPGETYTRSTPNSWTLFAADEALGLVFIPTGNPSPDFWGVKRRPFDEKYGSSIVALDIETGRPRWSYQTVHHDLWDYDVASAPSLIELPAADGTMTPALVQATKRGDLFVLDRRSGTPIVAVAERAVPQGAVKGDRTSKTQPFSALVLPSKTLTEASMWGATPFDQLFCRIKFRESRYEGMFTPPGLKPTIVMPGLTGVVNWGGVSIDLDRNVLIANYMMLPWRGQLIPRADVPSEIAKSPWSFKMIGTPFAATFTPWLGPLAVPCSEPPWGALAAIDLATQRVLWNEPLGTGEDAGPLGIPSHVPLTMGVPSMGGTLTTRGGLVFISGTLDRHLRAFDIGTGQELWRARLPAGGQATPVTYLAGGRQFVVVTSGGHSIMGTKFGDYTIAYALPKR